MGEISEALRRARSSFHGGLPGAQGRGAATPSSHEPVSAAGSSVVLSNAKRTPALAMICEPDGMVAESYRHAAVRLSRVAHERDAHSILVTSALAAEGKTTTACNLAIALASIAGGKRTLLLEADLRRPSIGRALGVAVGPSLSDVVLDGVDVAKACVRTQFPELDLLLAKPTRAPLDVVSNPALPVLLARLTRSYDLILIDTPPILPVPDVSLLHQSADGVLVVTRSGTTRRRALRAAVDAIGSTKLLGLFLNEARHLWRHAYPYAYDEPRAE
jgi:receptor protein-tyrosine kinase